MFDGIVQETFVSLVKSFPTGAYRADRARFCTFISAILRKRAVDFLRKSHRQALRFLPADQLQGILDASPDAFSAPPPGVPDTPERRELRSRLWSLILDRASLSPALDLRGAATLADLLPSGPIRNRVPFTRP